MPQKKSPQDAGVKAEVHRLLAVLDAGEMNTGALTLAENEQVFPSCFRIEAAAQASIALTGLLAAEVHRQRTGISQSVSVDPVHACAEFRSERYLKVDGGPAPELWDPIAGLYPSKDGFVRVHTNFPHHRDGLLALIGAEATREDVQAKLKDWTSEALETAMAERGLVGTATRRLAEWDAHPAAKVLLDQPIIHLTRIGDAPPRQRKERARPLFGLNALDLTRVIAGPVGGRTLAAHGANVLRITGPHLPFMAPLVMDAGRGKRSAQLDLRTEGGRETLSGLVEEADIFIQGYRPGGLADKGFSPKILAERQPGIISASLSAYGSFGPWAGRRGFDSLVQNASGLNWAEAEAAGEKIPKPLPCQALDHATGYFLAAGVMAALLKQFEEGGSWHVEVSLARTGLWLRDLGRKENGFSIPEPTPEQIAPFLYDSKSDFGRLTAVRHAAILSETPARWEQRSTKLDANPPRF